ncbi:MAG TPA: ATP-binding cassette domain-containing protein [Petrotogaceae bacterium]|nr:ATP-binding cassette domain-containing protein [Petrotogaceae bacterium]HNY37528.1 ATP-binding cassette domain-containing protein [Petrotogaceae bacterium]HOG33510.1 ATP-binding cassette domain-containing protein [Petrotogaceae bacterium]HPO27018.1 ATP-binding cassette domain-containing protein [Petrotogaceae bacterium]HPX15273.1 ATP-binding cassette domain-containing protein [Petrotogaceae bacterium]
MKNYNKIKSMKVHEMLNVYPYSSEFFNINGLPQAGEEVSVHEYFSSLPYSVLQDIGASRDELKKRLDLFIDTMQNMFSIGMPDIKTVTIVGGTAKDGTVENISLTVGIGEVLCIAGNTGSGKSRLLADIEWLAQADTPTKRKILVNGRPFPDSMRFSAENKPVAQLSQNMNFVLDVCVKEFIELHAQSLIDKKTAEKTKNIIQSANELSGEPFDLSSPLTSLSGGQARALMVADIAFLSRSPVILIDEIENAGIDRKKALRLLSSNKKIIIIATHDPLIALSADKRAVMKNGRIEKVIKTTPFEKQTLSRLTEIDEFIEKKRKALRNGDFLRE